MIGLDLLADWRARRANHAAGTAFAQRTRHRPRAYLVFNIGRIGLKLLAHASTSMSAITVRQVSL
jgi:hypothetical protein